MSYSDAGGFIPDEEPEQSSTNLPLSDYAASVQLPEQRHKPLRAGTNKEWDTNRWIESKMTSLNRKHAKRFEPGKAFGIPSQGAQDTSKETAQQVDDEPGYSNLRELAADVEQIMNVLWVCGTRKLIAILRYARSK
ncbi:hypothetical protein KEM55_006514 [Ascosphaera atra]|nr:hypothetical protein KEM55_006514 [Ascosphaera atra]